MRPEPSTCLSNCDTRARVMPTVAASASPECTSPSASWRRSVKATGVSTNALCLQHSAPDLIQLDRLEQGAEVAFAESFIALALNDLEKDRADDGRRENLQQHFVFCGIAEGLSKGPVRGRGCDPGGDHGTANRFCCHLGNLAGGSAIQENVVALEARDVLLVPRQPRRQQVIVGLRRLLECDLRDAQFFDGRVDVLGAERDMLDAFALVRHQIFLDLALVVRAFVDRNSNLAART